MPELPEVETIRRHLAEPLEGRRLTRVEILDPRWSQPLAPAELVDAVTGRTLQRLGRRGKYLIAHLEGDVHLLMHLRMTGTLALDPPAGPDPAHTRVRFGFDDDERRLLFVDPRRFGTGELALGGDALHAFLDARLGLEPFDEGFTPEHLRALAAGSRMPIKGFLLDQRRIAGVGNIYADEALFAAGIHPLREAGSLRPGQWRTLAATVKAALEAGIAAKGATIDDFRHPDGVRGAFQDTFGVHRRAGEPCPTCGTLVRKTRVAGRGTYTCDRCQPVPRARPSVGGRR